MLTRNLLIRFISASILIPGFLALLFFGGMVLQSAMLLAVLWAGFEWLTMINRPPQKRVWILVLFSLALTWGIALQAGYTIALLVCLSISLFFMLAFWLSRI